MWPYKLLVKTINQPFSRSIDDFYHMIASFTGSTQHHMPGMQHQF
jgi:hypothetical protein